MEKLEKPHAKDWDSIRAKNARVSLRKQVEVVRSGTHMAKAPLPLHKSVYTSQARFEAETQHIFHGQPLLACLSGDIPNIGDILVFDAAGPSILVMRGKDGQARAFLNMCTHRGAKLIEESEPWTGNAKKMTCPFHAWTFDTSGNLIGQPGKAGFINCDIGSRNLIDVPCEEYLGMIFVRANADGEPIDAKAHLGSFGEQLEQLELGRAEPVKKGILHADSNWKFALDTYGESYHFSTLHKSSIAKVNYNDKSVFDPYDQHHRVEFPKFYVGDLLDKDESEWPDTIYSGVHFLFPNSIIYFGAVKPGVFFTQVFRLFPDGVGKTKCHFAVYAPFGLQDEAQRQDCEVTYDLTARIVQEEDYHIASQGYANLLHAPKNHHVVIGANEIALHDVHKNIAAVIGMPLDCEATS
ncbi:MAG: aromatic ring-hydroxylating dioxygenase subunit alpha [Maricaulaceae bacterium]